MTVSNSDLTFFYVADAYRAKGYAVIPLWGEAAPERAKVAAVPWIEFQHRKPTVAELRSWFVDNDSRALAIVTGRISGIAVLDLDSQRAYDLFCQACPDLTKRHVIQTRRGYHIYFRIPPHLYLPSRKAPEADWLADGRYAVARPTPGYKLIKGGEPMLLDQPNLDQITAFLDLLAHTITPTPVFDTPVVRVNPLPVSAHTLVNQYHYLAPQIGRNETLFRVSLKARDHGWTVDETINTLADLHAHQPAVGNHRYETDTRRRKEAVATIYSAFSRPARPVQARQGRGLPVSVVEALHQQKLKCVVRVINALREVGVEAGELVCYTAVDRLLQGSGVGDWSVRKALRARLADGKPALAPSGLPPAPNGAAGERHQTDYQKNASLIERQNQQKVPTHRPAVYFVMPSDQELIERLQVMATRPDPMTPEDLATTSGTHLASLRELIARRPGQYPNQWLARREGVSKRTIQRYKKQISGLQVTPVYAEIRLHWGNLNELPDDDSLKGVFLEDDGGKRYPPIPGLAAKLLAKGRGVVYRRQQANYYHMVSAPVAALQTWALEQSLVIVQPRRIEPPPAAFPPPVPSTPIIINLTNGVIAGYQPALPGFFPFRPIKQTPVPAPKPASKRLYKRPLADAHQEALAQRVYQAVNGLTTEKAHRISLATARRWIASYPPEAVERTLRLLARRNNLIKPAGFFMTVLRCDAKFGRAG